MTEKIESLRRWDFFSVTQFFGNSVNFNAANTSASAKTASLYDIQHHPASLFLFVRFRVCLSACVCWFLSVFGMRIVTPPKSNIPQTFARATIKSSCPDSSHWKRLVPASCLLSHPCPSPTRRRCEPTPSLSNLCHLCHSCHLFLQHHQAAQFLTRHVKSSNTSPTCKIIWRKFRTNLFSIVKFHQIPEGSQ